MIEPVSLCNDEVCVGCGEMKTHQGKPVGSIICCGKCWRRLPKWMRDDWIKRACMELEERISIVLQWHREAK